MIMLMMIILMMLTMKMISLTTNLSVLRKNTVKQTVPGRSYRQIFLSGFSRRLIDPLYRPIFGLHILPTHSVFITCLKV